LGRKADGSLDGTFTANGDETHSQGDEVWQGTVAGKGTLAVDATDPEIRARQTSFTGGTQLLPWETIELDTAEPVGTIGDLRFEVSLGSEKLGVTWTSTATTTWA